MTAQIIRQIDAVNQDWTFGSGLNNYLSGINAIVQDVNTRLKSFLGNCFFDLGAGVDWLHLMGAKDQTALNLSISAVILNSTNVTGILQLSVKLDHPSRLFTVSYKAQTTLSTTISSTFQYDLNGVG